VLDISVEREACPLQLAPTASAAAALAMGDALAMTLMQIRRFQPEDFARLHPGGSLGRKLLTSAGQAMRRERLPLLPPEALMQEVVHQISDGRLGLVVIERGGLIAGIITDGDVRRAMKQHEARFFQLQAQDIMSPQPRIIAPSARLAEAEALMRQHKITSLLVAEEGRLQGVLQIYDLG
jgi:arabinose-5-phosphate isomerase